VSVVSAFLFNFAVETFAVCAGYFSSSSLSESESSSDVPGLGAALDEIAGFVVCSVLVCPSSSLLLSSHCCFDVEIIRTKKDNEISLI